ncbi:hypothetical protein K438DRAFT_1969620 [Mycena galopus ATCC 62051]|nr:hypothetical protein K438DRAFT_1996273 [Mycena galopus ATCC 62051]KAF8193135.1 hypothetical protein K438DRAFT_1969620 [Mycena galopus ATCC 62051]
MFTLLLESQRNIHEPLGRFAGLTPAQISAISNTSISMNVSDVHRDIFPLLFAAAMDFCDASNLSIKVPMDIFNRLKEYLSVKEMVEVTTIIGVFH